jgi:23S rRNA (guanosine2251-2'-O)-methyltransferase
VERRRAVARRRREGAPRGIDFDDVIYGIHSIEEALAAGERLRAIHVASDRKKDAILRRLLARAKELNVPVRFEDRGFFAALPFKAHQGVIAAGPPFAYRSLHEVLGAARRDGWPRLFAVLDHLTDPHNVGAIVRTAEAAGADAVILPERRSAGMNATVRKAAAGAAAYLPVARVANIADAIRVMKKNGIWIAGADAGLEAVEMGDVDLGTDLALVIGAEGSGLSQLVKRECDYLVRIPMRGKIGSLNASVAFAVLAYEVLRQRSRAR